MKVLLFAQFGETGGTRTVLKSLLGIHAINKIDTCLIYSKGQVDLDMDNFASSLGISSIRLPERRSFFNNLYFSFLFEFFYYSKLIKRYKPDLVLVTTSTQLMDLFLFFVNKPLIFFLFSSSTRIGPRARPLFWLISKFIGEKKIICCDSKYSQQELIKNWKVDPKNTAVIYNSFQAKFLNKLKHEKKYVLTLGQLVDYKNPFLWIEIAKTITETVPGIEFIWLGSGPLFEECNKRVEGTQRIKFLGQRNDLEDFYSKAAVYIQPSNIESHGLAVVDALACGIPCVVSNRGGLPESVYNSVNGFVVEIDKGLFCDAILKILENNDLWLSMSERARYFAYENFSNELKISKLLELYRRVSNYKGLIKQDI